MICSNCKSETHRITLVQDEQGNPFSFCPQCPRPKVENNFPQVFIRNGKKRGRPPKIRNDVMKSPVGFDKDSQESSLAVRFAKEGDMKKSKEYREYLKKNKLMGNPRDTPALRVRDDISNIEKRYSVIFMGDCRPESMQTYLNKKMDGKFGTGNWKIVKNDGVTITAEHNA